MEDKRMIKGSVIMDMVNLVRAREDLPWHEYLTEEDLKTVNSMVLPGNWYPLELSQRLSVAAFELLANKNMEMVEKLSRAASRELFAGVYKPFVHVGDPEAAIRKFLKLRESLYTFSKASAEPLSEKKIRVRITELGEPNEHLPVYILYQAIQFEELVAVNGGLEDKSETRQGMEDGQLFLEFDVSWK